MQAELGNDNQHDVNSLISKFTAAVFYLANRITVFFVPVAVGTLYKYFLTLILNTLNLNPSTVMMFGINIWPFLLTSIALSMTVYSFVWAIIFAYNNSSQNSGSFVKQTISYCSQILLGVAKIALFPVLFPLSYLLKGDTIINSNNIFSELLTPLVSLIQILNLSLSATMFAIMCGTDAILVTSSFLEVSFPSLALWNISCIPFISISVGLLAFIIVFLELYALTKTSYTWPHIMGVITLFIAAAVPSAITWHYVPYLLMSAGVKTFIFNNILGAMISLYVANFSKEYFQTAYDLISESEQNIILSDQYSMSRNLLFMLLLLVAYPLLFLPVSILLPLCFISNLFYFQSDLVNYLQLSNFVSNIIIGPIFLLWNSVSVASKYGIIVFFGINITPLYVTLSALIASSVVADAIFNYLNHVKEDSLDLRKIKPHIRFASFIYPEQIVVFDNVDHNDDGIEYHSNNIDISPNLYRQSFGSYCLSYVIEQHGNINSMPS